MHIFKNPHYDFIRWKWHAIILSWLIILAGAGFIWTKGMPKGVEFSGGTIVILKFDQTPSVDQVRTALDRSISGGGANAIVQQYGSPSDREVMIRVHNTGAESGRALSAPADEVTAAVRQANLGNFTVAGTEIVGPTVGKELQTRGTLATIFALGGILIYVAFRFQFSFAVGAVVATIHDLLVTIAFLAFFRYDLSLNIIAAILTITGYSMNDTIVIYDRIREDMRSMRRDDLSHIVNTAVNQMLDRTMITGGLTMLSVIALYLFGGEVLKGFAFTMIIGIITGTYSSVFIASAIVVIWQRPKRAPAPVSASAAPAGKASAGKAPATKAPAGKSGRARAS
jgi:preprotein translocase subunit SecF